MRPDAGDVTVLGHPRSAHEVALDGVAGFVEEPRFYPYLSAATNLELLARLDKPASQPVIAEALDRVGLGDRAGDRVAGFSTGMLQRLGIAAALLRQPRLLLLDEPTAGLDPQGTRAVCALLRELATSGVTVFLSSHHMGDVEQVCDSVTVLKSGRNVWSGTLVELRQGAPASMYRLSTTDNAAARERATADTGVTVAASGQDAVVLSAEETALDRFVLSLAGSGIAVRRLELVVSPLEAMYFALTNAESSEPLHDARSA